MQNTEDLPKFMLLKENISVLFFANASKQNKTPKCGSIDSSMIKAAGIGVAMGNALES